MLNGDKEARSKLIEHNLRLVAHIVKKFESTYNDVDDLIGIGTVGLIKGIDSFSPNKNVRLTTYIAKCAENNWTYKQLSRDHKPYIKGEKERIAEAARKVVAAKMAKKNELNQKLAREPRPTTA